jgi:hypothetical protein
MKRSKAIFTILLTTLLTGGCLGSFSLGPDSYVLRGTATAIEDNGSAFIWQADNGKLYLLFQDPRLPNQEFDTVITPGVRSRLELLPRKDLGVPFIPGAITADVVKVLEIIPAS